MIKTSAPLAVTPPRTDWTGYWIWLPEQTNHRNVYAHFRREISLDKETVFDIAITADSFYSLYLDGSFIGRGPSRSHLEYYSFDEYSLQLKPGPHCLAVLAHHIGEENACVMTGRPGLLVDVTVDGVPSGELSSGPGWRCLRSAAYRQDLPCTMSHFGFWEDCDLGRHPVGWDLVGYDDSAWAVPEVIAAPPCEPWPCLCPPDLPRPRYTTIPPASVTGPGSWRGGQPDPILAKTIAARVRGGNPEKQTLPLQVTGRDDSGEWILIDFGRTVSGDIELQIGTHQAGQKIAVSYDDLLEQGCVNPERSYAHLSDQYTLPGAPCTVRTYRPRGFRYVMIDVSGPGTCEIRSATAVEEVYPFAAQANFSCDDPALQMYHRKSGLTVVVCTTDSFTDCATRERVQWMEDLYMHSQVAACSFGDTRLLRRALFQGAQNALPDGRINGFMPTERTNCAFAASSIVWLHLLTDYYFYSGDNEVRRLLPTAEKLLAMIEETTGDDGLIESWPAGQFWDWAPIEGQGALLLTNAMYIRALRRLAGSGLVPQTQEEALFAAADRAAAAAHARYWDPERRLYMDAVVASDKKPLYSQHANTLAVLAGVCPEPERTALLKRIIDPAELGPVPLGEESLNDQNRRTDGKLIPVGTMWFAHFLCEALFVNGMGRAALEQMRMFWGAYDDLPTFPETRRQHGNTFLCHGWAAGPAYLLPAHVLGVKPLGPGWAQVEITPCPGDLAWASGTVPTPRGPLNIRWQCRDDGSLDLKVKHPADVSVHSVHKI